MHSDLEGVNRRILLNEAGGAEIVTRLFVHLSNGAVNIVFVFVDLASRKTPARPFLVPPDKHCGIHRIVEHDGSSHGDSRLVLHKFVEGLEVDIGREGGEKGTVLEHLQAEGSQRHGWQGGVQGSDEVFVEPLRLFNLKTDARYRGEVLPGEVYDESDAEVVQPYE